MVRGRQGGRAGPGGGAGGRRGGWHRAEGWGGGGIDARPHLNPFRPRSFGGSPFAESCCRGLCDGSRETPHFPRTLSGLLGFVVVAERTAFPGIAHARHSWERRFGGALLGSPTPRSKHLPGPRLHTKPGGRGSSAPSSPLRPPIPAGSLPVSGWSELLISASRLTPDPSTRVGAAR